MGDLYMMTRQRAAREAMFRSPSNLTPANSFGRGSHGEGFPTHGYVRVEYFFICNW